MSGRLQHHHTALLSEGRPQQKVWGVRGNAKFVRINKIWNQRKKYKESPGFKSWLINESISCFLAKIWLVNVFG